MSTYDWELSSHYTATSGRYQKLRESSVILANNKPAIESQYVKKHLGKILSECLAEICERRPHDPIEYIAQWIYKHRENEIRKMKVGITSLVNVVLAGYFQIDVVRFCFKDRKNQ